MAFNVV